MFSNAADRVCCPARRRCKTVNINCTLRGNTPVVGIYFAYNLIFIIIDIQNTTATAGKA